MQFDIFCAAIARFEGCPKARVHDIVLTAVEYMLKLLDNGDQVSLPGIGRFISEEVELKAGGVKKILVFKPGPGYSQFL